MMRRSKSHQSSQNLLVRIISSPIRALGKARDMYVRSITKCGQNMTYGSYPMDSAGRFSSLPRSHSAATSTRSHSSNSFIGDDDFAELMRVASARTLASRIDMDLVLKEDQNQSHRQQHHSKGLPKSSSVGMAKIDEDKPFDYSSEGGVVFVNDLYPRSRSYAVPNRNSVGSVLE